MLGVFGVDGLSGVLGVGASRRFGASGLDGDGASGLFGWLLFGADRFDSFGSVLFGSCTAATFIPQPVLAPNLLDNAWLPVRNGNAFVLPNVWRVLRLARLTVGAGR